MVVDIKIKNDFKRVMTAYKSIETITFKSIMAELYEPTVDDPLGFIVGGIEYLVASYQMCPGQSGFAGTYALFPKESLSVIKNIASTSELALAAGVTLEGENLTFTPFSNVLLADAITMIRHSYYLQGELIYLHLTGSKLYSGRIKNANITQKTISEGDLGSAYTITGLYLQPALKRYLSAQPVGYSELIESFGTVDYSNSYTSPLDFGYTRFSSDNIVFFDEVLEMTSLVDLDPFLKYQLELGGKYDIFSGTYFLYYKKQYYQGTTAQYQYRFGYVGD